MPFEIGDKINDRYEIEALLGQGGMGAVYRGHDHSLDIQVAVKENLFTSPEAQKQFTREARILARLSHPNLPRVIDHFTLPGQGQYLVMDYIEGEDLQSMLQRLGALPEPQVLSWISQICDALSYLHSQPSPIVHRDIKPANIKIRPDGRATLVDFGIAKIYDPTASTTAGARGLTPGYSPPEQYGLGGTDPRSDIYALGATLYHLLTGQKPPESIQRMVTNTALVPPAHLNPQISAQTDHTIRKAIEIPVESRFQSIAEMQTELTKPSPKKPAGVSPIAKSDKAVVAPLRPAQPVSTSEQKTTTQPPSTRRTSSCLWIAMGAGALLVILALVVVTGYLIYRLSQQPPASTEPAAPPTAVSQPTSTATVVLPASPTVASGLPLAPSATPVPTEETVVEATALPSPTPDYTITVTARSANVRTGPGSSYSVIISYPAGTKLTAIGRDAGAQWFVISLSPTQQGWISILVVSYEFDRLTLPIIAAPVPKSIPPTPYGGAVLVPPELEGSQPTVSIPPVKRLITIFLACALAWLLAYWERQKLVFLAKTTARQVLILVTHLLLR